MTRGTLSVASLPEGWARGALGEVAQVNYRDPTLSDLPQGTAVTFVPMAAVDAATGTIAAPERRTLSEVRKGYTQFLEGDVLFAKITPCMENGKAAIARSLANGRGFGSTEFHVLRPEPGILSEWLFYFIRQASFRAEAESSFTGTAGQLRAPVSFVRQHEVPVAPTAEQQRIVAKIEELFSQLDAGVAALERAKAKLQRYRQAVLKAAMSGELTREWREAHKDELEPGSVLLERISREREQAKGRSRQHFELDWSELPALPDGWAYLFLEDLSARDSNAIRRGPFGSAVRKEYFVAAGYKVYEQKNVIANDFTLGSYYIDQDKFGELKHFELRGGDVVVSCSGTIGKIAIAPLTIQPGIINQALLKITLDDSIVLPPYFVYLFKSKVHDIIRHSTRGSAMKNIASVRELKRIPFPVAPLPEQHRLVEEMEYRLSIADEMERALNETLVRGERLRQSILKMAFEGKLVPHDPTDEPASVLLERIKAEKAKRETEKKTRKKKPRKDTPRQLELI